MVAQVLLCVCYSALISCKGDECLLGGCLVVDGLILVVTVVLL